jgi:enoyl-CoA hydratase/carnithine racemase
VTLDPGLPVSLAVSGGIARLAWSRPARRNAVGLEICRLLTGHLERLAGDPQLAAIHLGPTDGPFCAGFDLTDLTALDGADPARRADFFSAGRKLMAALRSCPHLLLAAPRGYALGFGCAMLARCDLVIAADDAMFGIPEIRAGLAPTTVLPDLLAVMPRRTVLAWAVDGQQHTAEEARVATLVTSVAPAARHDEEVDRVVTELRERGALVRLTRSAFHAIAGAPEDQRTATAVRLATEHAAARAAAGSGRCPA